MVVQGSERKMIFPISVFETILGIHTEKHLSWISKSHHTKNPVLYKPTCEIQNSKTVRSNAGEYLHNLMMESIP